MSTAKFTILITTKNRLSDLKFTLQKIDNILAQDQVQCIICDDGSDDGTSAYISENFPKIHLIRNEKSKGLIYSRNRLMKLTLTEFAISIDDDLHFISPNPLEDIEDYFTTNSDCGVVGFRIFWSTSSPTSTVTKEQPHRMKSFAGGAHAWRMSAWRQIADYPAWFAFYGEEDFAAYGLFKKQIEIHYLPIVLVHHRVDLKQRKTNADYTLRLRRSLRSGWCLMFLFWPFQKIPRMLVYTIWTQFRLKVFKGDLKALKAIILGLIDCFLFIPNIIKNANRLTNKEYAEFQKIDNIKLYWKPEN